MKTTDELVILTRSFRTSDPIWNERCTIISTREKIGAMFDLSACLPFGWRLLKNKKAKRFIRDALKQEMRFRRDQAAREKASGN